MKKNYYLMMLFSALITMVFGSCENPDPQVKDPALDTPSATFDISVQGDLNEQLSADVKVNNYDGVYVVGVAKKSFYESEMESDSEYYAYYLIDEVQAEGSKLDRADNAYTFKGSSKVELGSTWYMEYDTDYIITAFGVSAEGEVSTEIVMQDYHSQAAPVSPFALAVTGASILDLRVDVDVADNYANDYMVGVVKNNFFQTSLANEITLLPGIVMADVARMCGMDKDPLSPENGYVYNGDQSIDLSSLWNLEPNTAYVVVAFGLTTYDDGVSAEPIIIEDKLSIQTADVTTNGEGLPSMSIEGTDDIDSTGFSVKITKDEEVGLYYVAVMSESSYQNSYGGSPSEAAPAWLADQEISADDYSSMIGLLPVFRDSGVIDLRLYYKLSPSSAYKVLAFGITSQGVIISSVAEYSVSTTAIEKIDGVSFDIAAVGEVTPTDFKVSVDPNDDSINYLVCAYESKAFSALEGWYINSESLAPDYEAAAQTWIDDITSWYEPVGEGEDPVYVNLGVADGVSVFNGSAAEVDLLHARASEIKPNTKYTVLAFGVTPYGVILTDITVKEIEVGAADIGSCSFNFREITPIAETEFGYAGSVEVTPSDAAAKYHVTVLPVSLVDGLSDQEVYDNNRLSMSAPYFLVSGVYKYDYSFVYEDSYIIAFTYDGGMTSAISKFKITLP